MQFNRPASAVLLLLSGALSVAQNAPAPPNHVDFTPQLKQKLSLVAFNLAQRKAAGAADHASCLLSMWYNASGYIQAVQIIRSSGISVIDQACLQSVIGQQLKIPPLLPFDVGGWTQLPINWVFSKKPGDDAPLGLQPDPVVPTLAADEPMPIYTPYYPDAALAQHLHGICKMHLMVSAAGDIDSLEITQSTGSGELDQACKDAIYDSTFVPAKHDGRPISGSTDVVLEWRLPTPADPPGQIPQSKDK